MFLSLLVGASASKAYLSMAPQLDLRRVRNDDPEYKRQAEAEMVFWQEMHPLGLEAVEQQYAEGPVDFYINERFTGDRSTAWYQTIARRGQFKRCAMLGTSSLVRERCILETNPGLHVTFFDISEGPLLRRRELFGKKFPGRIDIRTADLNFVEFDESQFDLIISSSTIHHVTNLEYFANEVNKALTADGLLFVEDFVGENRFAFSAEKKRIYEEIYRRDLKRQGRAHVGLTWHDTSDLSPFCGVRSQDILPVLRTYLREVEVRTAGALVGPTLRSRPDLTPDSPLRGDAWVRHQPRWRLWIDVLRKSHPAVFGRLRSQQGLVHPELLEELFTVGDILADCGTIPPGIAFASYRKRP